jgi:uncharacterized protein
MILDVQQLRETEEFHVDLTDRQCDFPADIGKFITPIHLDADIRKIDREVTIKGRISATIELTCARCLKQYPEQLSDSFEIIYRPRFESTEEVGAEIELQEADLDLNYYEGESISVDQLLRDQLLLLLPVKPLCRPDCAGLCPSCGQDLNAGSCSCAPETVDPRLAILKQLLKP